MIGCTRAVLWPCQEMKQLLHPRLQRLLVTLSHVYKCWRPHFPFCFGATPSGFECLLLTLCSAPGGAVGLYGVLGIEPGMTLCKASVLLRHCHSSPASSVVLRDYLSRFHLCFTRPVHKDGFGSYLFISGLSASSPGHPSNNFSSSHLLSSLSFIVSSTSQFNQCVFLDFSSSLFLIVWHCSSLLLKMSLSSILQPLVYGFLLVCRHWKAVVYCLYHL